MDGFTMDGDDGFDLDGEPVDLDGDGSADAFASTADLDGDGSADSLLYSVPLDTDHDGVLDGVETLIDVGGDGTVDAITIDQAVDTDADGQFDSVVHAVDVDADGTFDDGSVDPIDSAPSTHPASEPTPPGGPVTQAADLDGDGQADALVTESVADSDGDGVLDTKVFAIDTGGDGTVDQVVVEQQLDTDGDGRVDLSVTQVDRDGDGQVDVARAVQLVDTDGDGRLDTRAVLLDADGDGVFDEVDADGDGNFDEQTGGADTAADAYPDHANFDPSTAGDDVIGSPGDDIEHWHEQTHDDTCAVVSQEFILESLTGEEFDENELRQEAIDNGWYTPGGGTPLGAMGKLLEAHGIEVEREYGASIDDIEGKLESGEKVMVAIDAHETWNAGTDDAQDDLLGDVGGFPGQDVNHAVEVIGVDRSDPENPMVILNDPGHPDGRGMMVPLDEFMGAWEDSGNYMVSTV